MGIKLNFDNFVKQLCAKSFLGKGPVDTPRPRAVAKPAPLLQSKKPVQSIQPRSQITKITKTVKKPKKEFKPTYDFPPTSNDPRDEAFTREQIKKGIKSIPDIPKTIGSAIKRGTKKLLDTKTVNLGATKKNVDNITAFLGSQLGNKEFNKAYREVEKLVRDNKFKEAKEFVDNKLKKINNPFTQQRLREGGARFRSKR